MGSHYDPDHVDKNQIDSIFESLKKRADVMTALGQNQITAGIPGEQEPLSVRDEDGLHIRHMPDDPDGVTRISIGGIPRMGGEYVTYRGRPSEVRKLLLRAAKALS